MFNILNVIKHNFTYNEVVVKSKITNIKTFSQLIVTEGQAAVYMRNGVLIKVFTEGNYTIKSDILPILNNIINLPFGGQDPYSAEIWFVKTTEIRPMNWGTKNPIQLMDSKLNIAVSVRAFGTYALRFSDVEKFFKNYFSNMDNQYTLDLMNNLEGNISETIIQAISNVIIKEKVSVLEITANIKEISSFIQTQLKTQFEYIGILITDFSVVNINLEDDIINKINQINLDKMKLDRFGKDYNKVMTYKVLDNNNNDNQGINNNSTNGNYYNLAEQVLMANMLSDQFKNVNQKTEETINIPKVYFIMNDDGTKSKPLSYNKLKDMVINNNLDKDTLIYSNGMDDWSEISLVTEFKQLFN